MLRLYRKPGQEIAVKRQDSNDPDDYIRIKVCDIDLHSGTVEVGVEARELRSIDQMALVIGDCLERKGAALQRRINAPAAAISAVMKRPEVRPPRLGKLRVAFRRHHLPLCCIRAYCVRKEHADPCGHSPMSTAL